MCVDVILSVTSILAAGSTDSVTRQSTNRIGPSNP